MSNSKASLIKELKEKSFIRYFSDPLFLKENVLFKTKLNIGYHGEFDPGSG